MGDLDTEINISIKLPTGPSSVMKMMAGKVMGAKPQAVLHLDKWLADAGNPRSFRACNLGIGHRAWPDVVASGQNSEDPRKSSTAQHVWRKAPTK